MTFDDQLPADGFWANGALPGNVRLGTNTILNGTDTFKRFRSNSVVALNIGTHCTIENTQFAVGEQGKISIGNYCFADTAIFLCELEIVIGSYVLISWNVTIADSDFHPLAPAERIADAIACSPLAADRKRPAFERARVVIENGVWIGPNATILKGVRIGAGAFVEPGSLLTASVPPGVRVLGNPARIVGRV